MDNKDNSLLAFLLGGIIGVAIGILYAPKSGKETRAQLKQMGEDLAESAVELEEEVITKGKKFYADGKAKIADALDSKKKGCCDDIKE